VAFYTRKLGFSIHVWTRMLGAGVRGFIKEVLMTLASDLQGHRAWFDSEMWTGHSGQTLDIFGLFLCGPLMGI
jgi:hypothetical protein